MMKYLKKITLLLLLITLVSQSNLAAQDDGSGLNVGDLGIGIPWGGGVDENDICPQGTRVVQGFLAAWKVEDYSTMYELIYEKSKKDYSLEEARFDFQFVEFREYRISAVRKSGKNFEFFLSHGDWKDGNKDLVKMMIDGDSYMIIMPQRGSFFRKSI